MEAKRLLLAFAQTQPGLIVVLAVPVVPITNTLVEQWSRREVESRARHTEAAEVEWSPQSLHDLLSKARSGAEVIIVSNHEQKRYPGTLSEAQVNEAAAYVQATFH